MNGLVVSTDEITLSRRKNLSRSCISLVDLTSFRIGKKWKIKNVKHRLFDRLFQKKMHALIAYKESVILFVAFTFLFLSFLRFR